MLLLSAQQGLLLIKQTLQNHLCLVQAKQQWEGQERERQAAGGEPSKEESDEEEQFVAYVALPDDKEIENRIVQAKKASLLSKYTSEAIQREQEEAKLLLNKR